MHVRHALVLYSATSGCTASKAYNQSSRFQGDALIIRPILPLDSWFNRPWGHSFNITLQQPM